MKDLENLRKLMIQNGMIDPVEGKAGSFRIVPIGNPLFADKPPDDPVEGGGCGSCPQGCETGCIAGCRSGCGTGCEQGCTMGSVEG